MCIPSRDIDDLKRISDYADKILSPSEVTNLKARFIPMYERALKNYYHVNRMTNVLRFIYYISNIVAPVILITQNQTLFVVDDALKLGLFWSGISLNLLSTMALTLQDRWKLDQKSLLHRDFLQTLGNSFWTFSTLGDEYVYFNTHSEAYQKFAQNTETVISDNSKREQRLLAGNNRTLQPSLHKEPTFVNRRLPDVEAFQEPVRREPVKEREPV